MSAPEFQFFKLYSDGVEADRIATFLKSSGVPAYVDHGTLGVGLEGDFRVFVATELAHRARWLTSLPAVSEEELDFLATGRLPKANE